MRTGVGLPRRLLPLPRTRADRPAGRRMAVREGIGGPLTGMLTGLTEAPEPHRLVDGAEGFPPPCYHRRRRDNPVGCGTRSGR
ncbi:MULTISPECIES: hypothetical protein [Nocardiopsis]|uniref:Uncharacterized protein n=1 Tax=Nocardiopsis dassonvillei (strain ATCC 23218 / DSM 43111 / CIP 107115 / JCM 7437 / KCTC 9190 / NBRC 14626 / NCTC 10488 / NRRL B-5397 / IMRU 509) TaxID=446468 RepID=D7B5I2_NOCDD|nr:MULTISPECIES: hypothetical protein [Nocardiopsis]ADH67249.1 hypothetical protein Ndas_1821 [Nocardiopsis dassonvillei subsp. dassonvillei DSM 43111]VEI87330.1 Uncharacterised protein [Nocardiopsis dassonvillei]